MRTAEEFFRMRLPFSPGPTEAIDYLIDRGLDAIEISWQLTIPTYLVRDRFAYRAGQYDARARDLQMSVN